MTLLTAEGWGGKKAAIGDKLVATLNAMKDRKEPATVGGQAVVLAAMVRLSDAMIAVGDLTMGEKTQEKVATATARVKCLEDDFAEIKTDLKAMRTDLADIKSKVANLPTAWQIIGICATLIALVIGSSGGLLAILRYLAP